MLNFFLPEVCIFNLSAYSTPPIMVVFLIMLVEFKF